jgi:hypothetical protein
VQRLGRVSTTVVEILKIGVVTVDDDAETSSEMLWTI